LFEESSYMSRAEYFIYLEETPHHLFRQYNSTHL